MMKFEIASSSVAMKSDLLWFSLSHGKRFCVKYKRFLITSFPVHLVCSLYLVYRCPRCHFPSLYLSIIYVYICVYMCNNKSKGPTNLNPRTQRFSWAANGIWESEIKVFFLTNTVDQREESTNSIKFLKIVYDCIHDLGLYKLQIRNQRTEELLEATLSGRRGREFWVLSGSNDWEPLGLCFSLCSNFIDNAKFFFQMRYFYFFLFKGRIIIWFDRILIPKS